MIYYHRKVGNDQLGNLGTKAIGEALACNCTLLHLDLSIYICSDDHRMLGNNGIADIGAQGLSKGLATNEGLLTLCLSILETCANIV